MRSGWYMWVTMALNQLIKKLRMDSRSIHDHALIPSVVWCNLHTLQSIPGTEGITRQHTVKARGVSAACGQGQLHHRGGLNPHRHSSERFKWVVRFTLWAVHKIKSYSHQFKQNVMGLETWKWEQPVVMMDLETFLLTPLPGCAQVHFSPVSQRWLYFPLAGVPQTAEAPQWCAAHH